MGTREFGTRRQILVLAGCLLLLALVGWVDYVTGLEVSVVILYLLPVFLASWYGFAGAGYVVAILGALTWHVVAVLSNVSYSSPFMLYWNAGVQVLVFGSTAALTDAVRRGRQELEGKVEERTASLTVEIAERKRVEDRLRTTLAALEARSVQLRALALELTRAEQRERERLAALLHDDLQQLLVAAKVSLNSLGKESSAADRQGRLKGIQDLLDQSVKVSRSLAVQLSPPALHEGGLVAALRQLAQHTHQAYNLAVAVSADAEVPADTEEVCVVVYQAVRELLLNVVKHADASTARVSVRRLGPGQTEILVADEGLGFDPDKLKGKAGFGLRNTRGRIELVGGSMEIQSSPGHGTRVTIVAPVGSPADGAAAPGASADGLAKTTEGPSAGPGPSALTSAD